MKLIEIQLLKDLNTLPSLKPLQSARITIDRSHLNEIELILYSTNLCLFSMRILRNEIQVSNRTNVLNVVMNEAGKLYNLLSKQNILQHSNYTKKDTKTFFKSVGLKPKHLEQYR